MPQVGRSIIGGNNVHPLEKSASKKKRKIKTNGRSKSRSSSIHRLDQKKTKLSGNN